MQAIETTMDDGRELRRAGELIGAAVAVLREEAAEGGALSRAVERLDRVSAGLARGAGVAETHEALSHTLSIAIAARDALSDRARQCVDTFGAAQRIVYPAARAQGLAEPPPLPRPEPAPSGVERRTTPRVELVVEVGFETDDNFYTGFSEDVSEGGLFVATYRLAPIGTKIDLELTLPTGHVVRTRAEVRWLRDPRDDHPDARPGMGLRFEALAPEDARAMTEFIQARAPLFYED